MDMGGRYSRVFTAVGCFIQHTGVQDHPVAPANSQWRRHHAMVVNAIENGCFVCAGGHTKGHTKDIPAVALVADLCAAAAAATGGGAGVMAGLVQVATVTLRLRLGMGYATESQANRRGSDTDVESHTRSCVLYPAAPCVPPGVHACEKNSLARSTYRRVICHVASCRGAAKKSD
eukprot:366573-Chlamydomonas_euryale.AAC.39